MDEKQLQFLFNEYAKNKGFKDFGEFKSLMSDEGSRKVFFDDSNKELGFKDYNDFNETLGLKKNEPPLSVSSNTQLPLPSRVPKETSPVLTDLSFKNINQSLPSGGAAVKDVSEIDNIASSIKKGQLQGKIANTLPIGRVPNVDELGKVAEYQKELQSIPSSENEQAFQNEGFAIFKNPLKGAKFLTETIASSLSSLFESGKRTVPAAVGIGAIAGAPFAGIGALAGAGTGLTSGLTAAGVNLSTSGKILELLQSEGIDITDKDSLVKAFSDENKMAKLRSKANKYAIPIAVFDVASAGIGGELIGGAAGKTIAKKALAGLGEAGIQAAMGSGGELSGQLASGQKVDWNEVALEGISSLATDAPDVAIGAIRERAKASSNNKTIARQVATLGKEAGIEDATHNLNRDLANGIISKEEHAQGLEFAQKAAEVAAKIPDDVAPENKAKSIELIVGREETKAEIQQLEAEKETLDEAYHAELDEAIKAKKETVEGINKEVAELSKEKVKPEIQEEPLVTEAEIKTPQVEEQAIEVQQPTKVEIPITETVSEVKPTTEAEGYQGVFNDKKTGIRGLDELLEDDGYNFFYKGVKAKVEMMSPDEYLQRVRKGFKEDKDVNITESKKEAIKKAIKKGDKINMPYLSTKDGKFSQEGRNRAVVAKELGEEKIPVLVESDVTFEDKINKGKEYVENAIKEGAKTKEEVLSNLKEKKIHRDVINFIDNNFDEIAPKIETPIKEEVKVETPKTVEQLRAEEQAEYAAMTDPNDKVKKEEIYNKYDKLITPLLEKQKQEAKKVKLPTTEGLMRADAKKVHAKVASMEAPVNDARQIALRYIADGFEKKGSGGFGKDAIEEIAGHVKRARLNTGEKEKLSQEVKGRDYYNPNEKRTLDQIAHNLWEKSDQEVSEIDIKDALMEAAREHNTRLDAGKAYLERYNEDYAEEQHFARIAEERAEEFDKELKDIEDWLKDEGEKTHPIEAEEEHINNLIKQYEAEFKAENEQPTPASEGEVIETPSSRTGGEEAKKQETIADQYEAIKDIKSKKAQEKAKEKLINDNFESIVSQLMLKNKIKRIC